MDWLRLRLPSGRGTLLCVIVGTSLLPIGAFAAGPEVEPRPPAEAAMSPAPLQCRADVARLCSSVLPGRGRLVACLIERRTDLSPACARLLDLASDVLRR